jgi:hypothetical protein
MARFQSPCRSLIDCKVLSMIIWIFRRHSRWSMQISWNSINEVTNSSASQVSIHLQACDSLSHRPQGWHIVFESVGASFEHRFRGILKNIAQHSDLVMREATTIHLVEARQMRLQIQEGLQYQNKRRQSIYLHESISWLKFADEQQQDELERLSKERHGSTCEWVLRNHLFQSWNNDLEEDSILWIHGMPGTGES